MTHYIPPSIEDWGLEPFLNASIAKHNGLGYKEFRALVDSKVNIVNLARAFKVTRPTVMNWLRIYRSERGK